MKKAIFILLGFLVLVAFEFYPGSGILKSERGEVSFFSKAPIEDIDATSKNLVSVINTGTNEIAFYVSINSFQFDKPKMQTDFNENFMESGKHPVSSYKGKINEKIEWGKDGTHRITSKGILTIHGVAKERTDTATVNIKDGAVSMKSDFLVRVTDHNIKIPQLLYRNIAEVVSVKLNVSYVEGTDEEMLNALDK